MTLDLANLAFLYMPPRFVETPLCFPYRRMIITYDRRAWNLYREGECLLS